jgi:hypothetical protein
MAESDSIDDYFSDDDSDFEDESSKEDDDKIILDSIIDSVDDIVESLEFVEKFPNADEESKDKIKKFCIDIFNNDRYGTLCDYVLGVWTSNSVSAKENGHVLLKDYVTFNYFALGYYISCTKGYNKDKFLAVKEIFEKRISELFEDSSDLQENYKNNKEMFDEQSIELISRIMQVKNNFEICKFIMQKDYEQHEQEKRNEKGCSSCSECENEDDEPENLDEIIWHGEELNSIVEGNSYFDRNNLEVRNELLYFHLSDLMFALKRKDSKKLRERIIDLYDLSSRCDILNTENSVKLHFKPRINLHNQSYQRSLTRLVKQNIFNNSLFKEDEEKKNAFDFYLRCQNKLVNEYKKTGRKAFIEKYFGL